MAIFCEHNLKNNGPPVLHIRIYWQTERNWKVGQNEREGGRRMQEENKCETNVWKIWKKSNWKSDWKILLCEKAQTGGRKKSSSTAAPSELARGWSMRKCEFTCWEGQFCAELSTFNENFCRNLPWKKNSPLSGHSFSRPTSTSGSGNLTSSLWIPLIME